MDKGKEKYLPDDEIPDKADVDFCKKILEGYEKIFPEGVEVSFLLLDDLIEEGMTYYFILN